MALVCSGIVAIYFAAMTVLPLSTMGDPAYDIPMLRTRWYAGFYIFPAHLMAILLALVLAIGRRNLWAALGFGLSAACLYAIFTEEGRFIRYDDLTDRSEVLMPRLLWSRLMTMGLSAGAVLALWRADVRR